MGLSKVDLKDYKKVRNKDEQKDNDEPQKENEFKVGPVRSTRTYISSAIDVLDKGEHRNIVLLGRGQTISKVVNIAEVLKRRIPGLHQLTETESTEVVDVYEPKDPTKSLEKQEVSKYICGLSITLSLDPLDTSKPGYQQPLHEGEVTEEDKERRANRARGDRQTSTRGRGGKGSISSGRGKSGRGGDGRGASRGRGGSSGAQGSAKGGFKDGSRGGGSKGGRGGGYR
ncbi:hypothetical protein DIPPA_30330 [Diplonema papillatum]|nr:hypothetical protein DIPPA_30330 [Diplonema papillatum]KAJ9468564.1 hypothetical protein DIPPA_30330 [Diplonema papillatum]